MDGEFCRNTQLPLLPVQNGSQRTVHRLRAFVQVTVADDFAQRAMMLASVLKSMVRYGCDQSPTRPDG